MLWYSCGVMEPISLYLHIPFCTHRCSYCDFNTFAGQERKIPAYVAALCSEIQQVAETAPARLRAHTIFFGGGTPSLLQPEQIRAILDCIRANFSVDEDAEITLEANPGTVTCQGLQALRAAGANRLSFGMQSAHPDDLRLLERQHDFRDVIQAVQWARQASFDNLSVDLIFGLPDQGLPRWQESIRRAVNLQTEHLSLYALTIEHGTPLYRRWAHGMIPTIDDDLAADMYESAMQLLEQAGFEQYEISNWARRAVDGRLLAARHNLQYWRNLPYLGLGAGAHGYAAGVRTANIGGIQPYIDRCAAPGKLVFPRGPAARRAIAIDRRMEMEETMMVGLRLTQEGVSRAAFARRFGEAITGVFGAQIEHLQTLGLLEWNQDSLRLTRRGRLLGNQVFAQFVSG